jgi:hypothetical protein
LEFELQVCHRSIAVFHPQRLGAMLEIDHGVLGELQAVVHAEGSGGPAGAEQGRVGVFPPVGHRFVIEAKAANLERTELRIERELPEIHGTPAGDGQPLRI